jgi:hypothetical protein
VEIVPQIAEATVRIETFPRYTVASRAPRVEPHVGAPPAAPPAAPRAPAKRPLEPNIETNVNNAGEPLARLVDPAREPEVVEPEADPMDIDEDSAGEGDDAEVDQVPAAAGEDLPNKRRRVARKLTVYIFVDRIPNHAKNHAYCRLGCLSTDSTSRWEFAAPNTAAVRRHVSSKHPEFLVKFDAAKDTEESINALLEAVGQANAAALKRIEKLNAKKLQFFNRLDTGLSKKLRSELCLVAWAIANNIPRLALNCPLFDAYLASVGAESTSNRHDLEALHLEALDNLVVAEYKKLLSTLPSVSISHDGWKDRAKRNWVDLGAVFIDDSSGTEWKILAVDLDIIPLPGQSTGENLETLLKESLQEFIPGDTLIATSTRDGGGDERVASSELVKEGNSVHCVAHKIQLCVHDALDPKKAEPPMSCQPHRSLIQKARSIVVFINGHKDVLRAFQELVKEQKAAGPEVNWEILVLDNDTRWDTWLYLLERVVFFVDILVALGRRPALRFPPDLLLNGDEHNLAYAMTLILSPIKAFTKFVQTRSGVTLGYVPGRIDEIITEIRPNAFADRLRDCSATVREQANVLQLVLVESIKNRFADMFLGGSLALAARSLLPGKDLLNFQNFDVTNGIKAEVFENMVDDAVALLPAGTPEDEIDDTRISVGATLRIAFKRLAKLDRNTDILKWMPNEKDLAPIFPLSKMLYGVPATSADNERSFSSASFTLDFHRYRLAIDVFRKEHRLRRYLVSGTDSESKSGREARLLHLNRLLNGYDELVNRRVPQEDEH